MAEENPLITSRPITFTHKVPILKTRQFWEKLEKGEVYATKCRKCGKLYYPPQDDCARCLSSDVEWVKLNNEAILETYTYAPQRPAGFNQYEPYTIAIARTKDGARVMGWLEDLELEDVKVGMKLVMSTKKLPDGFLVITFKPDSSRYKTAPKNYQSMNQELQPIVMAQTAKLNPATSKTSPTNLLFFAFTMAYEDFGIYQRFFHKAQELLQIYGTKALLWPNNHACIPLAAISM